MYLVKQETIEHARFRALAQITIDKEKGIEAFEEYMKIAFPYLAASKDKERASFAKILQEEVGRGALKIKAIQQPTLRSKVAAAKSRTKLQSVDEEKRLYKKIGRVI